MSTFFINLLGYILCIYLWLISSINNPFKRSGTFVIKGCTSVHIMPFEKHHPSHHSGSNGNGLLEITQNNICNSLYAACSLFDTSKRLVKKSQTTLWVTKYTRPNSIYWCGNCGISRAKVKATFTEGSERFQKQL